MGEKEGGRSKENTSYELIILAKEENVATIEV